MHLVRDQTLCVGTANNDPSRCKQLTHTFLGSLFVLTEHIQELHLTSKLQLPFLQTTALETTHPKDCTALSQRSVRWEAVRINTKPKGRASFDAEGQGFSEMPELDDRAGSTQ